MAEAFSPTAWTRSLGILAKAVSICLIDLFSGRNDKAGNKINVSLNTV